MTGEHLRDLVHRSTGIDPDDVDTSQFAWNAAAVSLSRVGARLNKAAPKMLAGFGPDSLIGQEAQGTFVRAAERVLERRQQLKDASDTLIEVATAMADAKAAAADPPAEPGPAPKMPSGIGSETDDLTALKVHAGKARLHANAVNAYGDADEDARVKVEALKEKYTAASGVLAKIHGDPYVPPPGSDPQGGGPGGGSGVPAGGRSPYGGVGRHPGVGHPLPHVPLGSPHEPLSPHTPVPYGPVEPGGQGHPPGPAASPSSDGGGFGVGPAVIGGGVAAGVFGGPGVVNGIRSLLSGRNPLSSAGTIGSTNRTGGPGSLGRSTGGTGSPGSQVNRNAGRGAGGRGTGAGGRGATGSPGGRGTRGTGTGAGGRGRKKKDADQGQDRDLFDDGQDWLDDEGAGPGLLT